MADSNRPESGDPRSSRPDLQSDGPLEIDLSSVIVRRSDGDDCQILEQVIDPQTQDLLDLLYNYPRLIQRVEACYLSITIIDSQYRVIGMAIFEDFPQGLEGMYDYLHENSWEQWLPQAFNIREEFDIRPFNSLWLVYFYLDRKNFRIDATQEHELLRMVFQNVYATNPNIEGINFLLRGDVVDEVGTPEAVKSILNRLFIQIPVGDINALKKVRGIQPSSQMFYSPRQKCFEYVEIRIAKQEDHDDLAEIFNKQSEVLTTQFGEFFIAELIAFQNENQKALVAQVDDRAVGLMSISKDIDYKLLAEGFELEQYDNLLRAEFMEAVKDRKDDIVLQKHYEEVDRRREAERKILEEKMLTSHWGQRIALQQHLRAKETKIKDEMIGFTGNEELNKTLTREIVENMIDEWLTDFKLTQPSDIFYEQGVKDPEINCWVITERNFFLETLVYFGLPKGYLEGFGHWHDWAYVKLIERKQQLLRKAPKKQKQPVRRAGRARQEEKKDDDYNEPSFFDLMPLQRAFDKFMASGPDVRTTLRNTILDNMKKFVLIFSDENGELLKGRNVDVTELGDYLKEAGINLPAAQWEYIPFILDCFGDLKFDKRVTKVMPQDEKAKREELKDVKSKKLPAPLLALKDAKKTKEKEKAKDKDKEPEPPKDASKEAPKQPPKEDKESKEEFKADPKTGSPETKAAAAKEVDPGVEKLTGKVRQNDIVELFSAFEEIMAAIEKVKAFDQMMMKLGVIKEDTVKDPTLKTEVKDLADKAVQDREDELRNRERNLPENPWRELASNLDDLNGLPGIPIDAHNAIAINLFCIDENYESRSIDFLEYAFNLFPDRDYIILTQPHIVNESILLQSFIQIPKKKNAIFDDVLYVFHKDALLAPLITVRRSTIEDLQDGQFLYAHMSQAAQIESDALESIKSLTSNKIAFTVLCQDTIIGFYILTKDVNLLYYKSHFAIQDFMVLNEHPRNGFSKILYAILNPVFSKYTRYILKELMRLANKTCMYFEIHKDTALPDIFSELILTRNRKFPHLLERKWNHERDPEYMEKFQDLKYIQDGERDPMDEKEASFSLAMITKKLLSVNKINDNTRIVVVGASDTGISLIESLLSVRYVNFPHITLLAPGGMRAIHAKTEYLQMKGYSTNYTLVELRNLLLDSRITVIDARMVNIDRKNKTIKLDKQAILPYDVLVLTLGLCDTQLQDMQLVSEGIGKLNEQYGLYPDRTFIKGVYSIDDPYLYDIFAVNKGRDSPISRLARRKRPEDIVLYGRSLHVYSFINGLINRGVKPERIKLVIPPKTFDRKKEFPSNQDRWDYEDLLVWDPPAFEEEAIEEKVHQILVKLGVQMYTNLKLHAFETDKDNHLQVAIFKKYGENGEPIEKKAKAPVEDEDEENEEDHEHLEGEEGEDEEGEENGEGEEEEEESDEERIPVRMLVTSRTNDIDLSFFYAIHENGLVYNGRLIVKRNFQTTDPAIFAAGRLCEFSQRYKNQAIGTPLRLDKYSGREVGQKLSRAIMEHIGLLTPEVPEGGEEELPTFFMPMGVGGVLPNDLFYYYVRKIEWARPQLTIEAGKNREDIVCDNLQGLLKGHYIKFTFDHNGIIDSVTYLGSEKIVVQSLVAFVGLSEKYLNKLDTRFKDGLIENVAEFLSENWAIALYHEWFSIFRHKTKMEIANKPSIQEIFDKVIKKARKGNYLTKARYDKLRAKVSLEVTKAIEDGTLDFIRENLNHLPMYYIPDEEFK